MELTKLITIIHNNIYIKEATKKVIALLILETV